MNARLPMTIKRCMPGCWTMQSWIESYVRSKDGENTGTAGMIGTRQMMGLPGLSSSDPAPNTDYKNMSRVLLRSTKYSN